MILVGKIVFGEFEFSCETEMRWACGRNGHCLGKEIQTTKPKASVKGMKKEPTFVKVWCVPGTALCVLNKISSYNLKAVAPKYEYPL